MILCPVCQIGFNWEARLNKHIEKIHALEPEAVYIEHRLSGVLPKCLCGKTNCQRPTWYGWEKGHNKYVRGHNAVIAHGPEAYAKSSASRVAGYAAGEYKVWNDGLTKSTDIRVKDMSEKISVSLNELYSTPDFVHPRSGQTKETNESIRKMSETKIVRYASGEIKSWNEGLTKDSDERIKKVSERLVALYKTRPHHRSLSSDEILSRVEKSNNFELLTNLEYKNKYDRLLLRCKTCGETQNKSLAMIRDTPICFMCHPKSSVGQLEIYEFMKQLEVDTTLEDRDVIAPQELDIFSPVHKFAVEFNGIFWHSERWIKEKNYHENKSELCRKKGVRLLHVFSDEWKFKRPIVESMIRSRLGLCDKKIMARKCRVVELNSILYRRLFFEENHLDGDTNSKVAFGLYDGEILVACLSLRKPGHKKYVETGAIEIARFCTLLSTQVSGALGKLTEIAKKWSRQKGYKKLMTYVDTRLGDGHGYMMTGFKDTSDINSSPRFWWTDNDHRYDRFKFRADSKRNMSEADVAKEAGVVKIWGCKNKRFELDLI